MQETSGVSRQKGLQNQTIGIIICGRIRDRCRCIGVQIADARVGLFFHWLELPRDRVSTGAFDVSDHNPWFDQLNPRLLELPFSARLRPLASAVGYSARGRRRRARVRATPPRNSLPPVTFRHLLLDPRRVLSHGFLINHPHPNRSRNSDSATPLLNRSMTGLDPTGTRLEFARSARLPISSIPIPPGDWPCSVQALGGDSRSRWHDHLRPVRAVMLIESDMVKSTIDDPGADQSSRT